MGPQTRADGRANAKERTSAVRCALVVALATLSGCIQVTRVVPEDVKVETPDPFLAPGDPDLATTDVEGLFGAPELDPNCYFYEPEKSWYRYWNRNWFQAFRWDGAWFLLRPEDVPAFLRGRVDLEPIRERAKSREERLRELEQQYEEIERRERERQERELGGADPRSSDDPGPGDAPGDDASP